MIVCSAALLIEKAKHERLDGLDGEYCLTENNRCGLLIMLLMVLTAWMVVTTTTMATMAKEQDRDEDEHSFF